MSSYRTHDLLLMFIKANIISYDIELIEGESRNAYIKKVCINLKFYEEHQFKKWVKNGKPHF